MKCKTALLLTTLLFGSLSLFSACERASGELPPDPDDAEQSAPVHVHSYVTAHETPADCLCDGERLLVCPECGDEKTEVLTALGHDFFALSSDDSTCIRQGYTERKCTRCGTVEREDLPLAEHDWTEMKVLTEPTCTEDGLKAVKCRVCHLHRDEEVIPARGHDFEEHVLTEPTCTEEGVLEKKCKLCKLSKTQPIPTIEHEFEEHVLTEPTCTEEGVLEKKCKLCKLSKTQPIPKISHKWGNISVLREATCTQDGLRSAVCEFCGLHESEQVIPARGHDYSIVVSRCEPDCTHDGSLEMKCSRCDDKTTKTLAATGHKKGETKVLEEATCSREGKSVSVCSVCGETMSEGSIPKTSHVFGAWRDVALPTCEDEGERDRACEVCGAVEKQSIPAHGHNFDPNFTVDKIPTMAEDGLKSRHCLNEGCGKHSEETVIGRLGVNTEYSVSLRTSTGGAIKNCEPKVEFYDGENCVGTASGLDVKLTLPTKKYRVKVSELPAGYFSAEEFYEIEPFPSGITVNLPAALISEDAPLDTKYVVGSVLHDRELTVLGTTEDQDRVTTFGEILSNYKAILLNMYFCDCGACVWEMPYFVSAYQTQLSGGKIYGEEVACVMLDNGYEQVERVRKFIKKTNTYHPRYSAAEDIPMMVVHDRWLSAFFTRKIVSAFPTSILIDCEGVIMESHTGAMYTGDFRQMMQRGIDRYEAVRAWRIGAGLEVGEDEPLLALPACDLPFDRKRSF